MEDTFQFPEGTIVSRGKQSAAPDPQQPDHFLVGVYPPESLIVSTTGAFRGRGGHVRMSGRDDCSACPAFAVLDDVWLIELHPRVEGSAAGRATSEAASASPSAVGPR